MDAKQAHEARHPIQVAARRSGLTPDTLRAWERRYQAIEPRRVKARRRLYSDVDIERLTLLRHATDAGRAIRLVASLPTVELRRLVEEDAAAGSAGFASSGTVWRPTEAPQAGPEMFLAQAIEVTSRLDQEGLETLIRQASVSLGRSELIDRFLVPLLRRIGELWYEGHIRIMHEHMASAVLLTTLGHFVHDADVPKSAPRLVVATPPGQMHGLGALLVAATATLEGWRSIHLGVNLPVEEIAGAVAEAGAAAVALSLIYPADDGRLHEDLRRLRRLLPEPVVVLAGGAAAAGYGATLEDIGAETPEDLGGMREVLRALRLQKPLPRAGNKAASGRARR